MNDFRSEVRPQDISAYLASKGWQRDGDQRGSSVWRLGTQARLLVPGLDACDDADQLTDAAVATIARHEARPEFDVRRDIAEPLVDAQFFRLHPGTPAGSITLPAGVKAAQGVLELMKSAATAIEQGSLLRFEGRRSQRVDSFLHTVLLGAAAPGSYVLTARVPTAPVGPQQLDLLEESREFSGRAITAQLRTAIEAAWAAAGQALREHGNLEPFYACVENGVSANLCWALRDLGGEKRDQRFEIGFSWARGVPGQEPAPEFAFTSEMPAVLGRAGDELAALARMGAARITGLITHLHDERSGPSRIKVRGDIRTPDQARFPRRAIWVVLNADSYQRAIEAHRDGRLVAAEGRLVTSARRLELSASSFQVLR